MKPISYERDTIKKPTLEKMSDFFTARIDGYDDHMLTETKGCKEAYKKLAELVPTNTKNIFDLGCGTGLELDEIFKRLPHVTVVGIDLTQAMLDKLKQKHPDENISLICGNYFNIDLTKIPSIRRFHLRLCTISFARKKSDCTEEYMKR